MGLISNTLNWIKNDFHSHPIRFTVELIAWAMSISCSLILAITVPNPPLLILYPLWVGGSALYAWAAWTRRSFGMLANYMLLTTIDTIGLLRMIL